MDFNINDFHVTGNPDFFYVYSGDTYIGYCSKRSYDNFAFAIWDGKPHISKKGSVSHVSFINDYENLRKRDDWSSGRYWESINRYDRRYNEFGGGYLNKNVPFDYSFLSFWWGKDGDLHLDKKIVDKLVKKLSKGNVDNVLVASFNDDDYGKVYKYSNWIGRVSGANEKQQEIYNMHVMDASRKHDLTSNFRDYRDREIGKRLTNGKGVEMPVAQYRSMIYSESEKRYDRIISEVINRYLGVV